MNHWETYPHDRYVGLYPWVWVQLESADPPPPFPFLGGVAPDVVGSLHHVHGILQSAVETAISDIIAERAPLHDPALPPRLEDAYAEVVHSRPFLRDHIHCGRRADGTFHWSFVKDPQASATLSYGGLRIFNAATRNAVPFGFAPPLSAPLVGEFLGLLDGTRTLAELRSMMSRFGHGAARPLSALLDALDTAHCLALSPSANIASYWLSSTQDRDTVHLGHAALMYRQQNHFLWFDPWLMPWFAESPVPSLWTTLLPRPAAIFLTHDHDDHVDPRTLLHLPKDIPIFVPSRANATALYYDYPALLHELGFTHVTELAHGESWAFPGGAVVAVPFYGEDPCDVELPRNCYLIVDRGVNTLVHADSGPTNDGRSALRDHVIAELVARYGPIATVFASQQQLKEVRSFAAYACLSPPGRWLDVGENGFLTNEYLRDLCAEARAVQFFSYATGGADWYPDHLSFMFSHRNPARTALLTAHWDQPHTLDAALRPLGCRYHYGQALDIVRVDDGPQVEILSAAERLAPLRVFQLDHELPEFLRRRS